MDARGGRRVPLALGVVAAAACIAGVGSIGGSIFLLLEQGAAASAQARAACSVCGVVAGVRPVRLAAPPSGAVAGGMSGPAAGLRSGASMEGVVILLASLGRLVGAAPGGAPATVYEVTVRFTDGSERALREVEPPRWKPGDRVRVVKGRIEPLS